VVQKIYEKKSLCMHTKTTVAQKLSREYKRKIIEFHKYVIQEKEDVF